MRVLRCVIIGLALGLMAVGFHPVDAVARQSMSFSPGNNARPVGARVSRHARAGRGRVTSRRRGQVRSRPTGHVTRGSGGADEGDAARAVPGKGFTLENGILTYPAPARFQPQNLKPH